MNKRLIGVAIAAVLALVGTILILSYVNDADDRARAEVELGSWSRSSSSKTAWRQEPTRPSYDR